MVFIVTNAGGGSGRNRGEVNTPTSSVGSMVIGSISDKGGPTPCSQGNVMLSFFAGPSIDCCKKMRNGHVTIYRPLNGSRISKASFTTP